MGFPGREGQVYYDSAWTTGSAFDPALATWVKFVETVDLAFAGGKGEADISSRATTWQIRGGALKDAQITFGYRMSPAGSSDAGYDQLVTSYTNDTIFMFAIANADIATTGAVVWYFPAYTAELGEEYPLTDGQISNITINNTFGEDDTGTFIPPTRYVVT